MDWDDHTITIVDHDSTDSKLLPYLALIKL